MVWNSDETIVALASASGPAWRGIVRISGPQTSMLLDGWIDPNDWKSSENSKRYSVKLRLRAWDAVVSAELQWWPTHRSYTGQPLAELHLVGSPPLLQEVLIEACGRGARLAEPGEFTLRAFLAGRLDLLQAEGVLGVIDATNQRQLEAALGQLAGGISHRLAAARHDLLDLLADLEAGLDFVEEHLEFVTAEEIGRRVRAVLELLEVLHKQSTERMHAGERPRVVLAGLTNAGKSTLFNALVPHGTAIVSAEPGTTRDYLVGRWSADGLDVDLVDTAGWEQRCHPLTRSMADMRDEQVQNAALLLWCRSARLSSWEDEQDHAARASLTDHDLHILDVVTKCDPPDAPPGRASTPSVTAAVPVSAWTGSGLDELGCQVRERLEASASRHLTWLGSSAARCRESLSAAREALEQATEIAAQRGDETLLALELRRALHEVGAIVGEVYTDDLLDRIFSRFCIGK